MCLGALLACMSVYHICMQEFRGLKRTLDPLGLEFQKVLRHHVGAGCWVLHLGLSAKGHLGSFCNVEH